MQFSLTHRLCALAVDLLSMICCSPEALSQQKPVPSPSTPPLVAAIHARGRRGCELAGRQQQHGKRAHPASQQDRDWLAPKKLFPMAASVALAAFGRMRNVCPGLERTLRGKWQRVASGQRSCSGSQQVPAVLLENNTYIFEVSKMNTRGRRSNAL
ncbi:hypothetical protein GQ54DRAFT_35330 [Martensiomyces pterosporus]|nr:hypothetical protein GQ54DRAFT_35330 [Martensiomyces pterosporus]